MLNEQDAGSSVEDDISRIFSPFNIPAIAGWYIPKKIFDAAKDRGDLSILGCESPMGTKVVIKAVSTQNVVKHLELIEEAENNALLS
jgi:hypothetical protein